MWLLEGHRERAQCEVKLSSNVIGTKRTLVFHLGPAPNGESSEWMMHEYCINDKPHQVTQHYLNLFLY